MPGRAYDDTQDHRAFGRALRRLRQHAGLNQEELASRVGISARYVSQLEYGDRGARWHTVMRLLRALDATLADLEDAIERSEQDGLQEPRRDPVSKGHPGRRAAQK